jgi:hypothetical protein
MGSTWVVGAVAVALAAAGGGPKAGAKPAKVAPALVEAQTAARAV